MFGVIEPRISIDSLSSTPSLNDDENSDVDYLEKPDEGHKVETGTAANPQFVYSTAVESAVASLVDPSDLESQVSSTTRSPTELGPRPGNRSPAKSASNVYRGSPLRQRQDALNTDKTSFSRRMGAPQSVTPSSDDMDESVLMLVSNLHRFESQHEDAESQQSESEVNTNPTIIQGPIGGVPQGDQWRYRTGSPPVEHYYNTPMGGPEGSNTEQQIRPDAGYYETAQYIFGGDDYFVHSADNQSRQLFATPSGAKDECYASAANTVSPSTSIGITEQASRGLAGSGADAAGMGSFRTPTAADDHFASGHEHHFSDYSHDVGSLLSDSATGCGIERIQSEDIVALMNHLTVRDAQRNARDTEILVTLVRSAAEMRTSFEQMEKFIAEQCKLILDTTERGHERTQTALGGPRPLPPSGSRNRQLNTAEEDKRKNILKRVLKGLSLKGNDLSKIEGVLEQLLDEVEALRAGQEGGIPRNGSTDLAGHGTYGQNGAPIGTSRSPYGFSPSRPFDAARREPDQCVSKVREIDEYLNLHHEDQCMTSHLPVRDALRRERSGSLPLDTPPRKPVPPAARSTDNTPNAEKARKNKPNGSPIFPKTSRWFKSTATSVGNNIHTGIQPSRKERLVSDKSRSGSDIAPLGAYTANYYAPNEDDRIRSTYTFDDEQGENRPPSPSVPFQVSYALKYRGPRGSLELQHPQPRQGPTGRYQSRLETEAQTFSGPISPMSSDQWGSNSSLSAASPIHNRNSGVSGKPRQNYSEASSPVLGPPRPPQVKEEGPLVPCRPPKVTEDEEPAYSANRVASRSSVFCSPPTRKPTGPRPLIPAGSYSPGKIKQTRYRGRSAQIDYSDDEH
ncbi:hypothetical protein N7535_000087 [Penicillium sp. DV-2018c]|nr:hypothetical protein N7535_000087 [Penicillium sp. DV-2018c]